MEKEIIARIRERFSLETEALLTERQIKNLEDDIRLEKHLLRERKVARVEYDGSLKSKLDAVRGKKAERIEELDRAVRQAEANIQSRQRQLEQEKQTMAELETKIPSIPDRRTLREQTADNPEARKEYGRRLTAFCARKLEPMLRENLKALIELDNVLKGNHTEGILSAGERCRICSKPEQLSEEIRLVMLEMAEALAMLDVSYAVDGFFEAPSAYLNPAAAHSRWVRVRNAMDETRYVLQTVSMILEKLG